MNSAREVFKYFVGTWDISRIVGSVGIANGVAKFMLQDGGDNILFREDVKVKYNNAPSPESAYKEYIYLFNRDEQKIIKQFTDGRLFYELVHDFNNRKAYGNHLCECDTYNATYSFLNDDSFILSYDVKGPQKNYIIETKFMRNRDQ